MKWHSLLVLVDSGATHNFLHPKIAKRCGLQVTQSEPVSIKVANGSKERSLGHCIHVLLTLQGHVLYPNFHLLPFCGYEVVVGAEWLLSLRYLLGLQPYDNEVPPRHATNTFDWTTLFCFHSEGLKWVSLTHVTTTSWILHPHHAPSV